MEQLVPPYLPEPIPDESATSGYLMLRVGESGPVVYGKGLDDDGGTPPSDYRRPMLGYEETDGDRVLYPPR